MMGIGVPHDLALAYDYLKKAHTEKSPEGTFHLGEMFDQVGCI